ncbi:Uncharacterized protein At5g39865 [Linum perenne]
MGCASSKRIEAAVDVYRPPPSSFAVFDVASIQEPWLSSSDDHHDPKLDKPSTNNNVPPHLLDKLHKLDSAADVAPRSWDEVSKDLEDLKPAIKPIPAAATAVNPPSKSPVPAPPMKREPRRSFSFHTLEELDSKSTAPKSKMRKSESARSLVDLKKKLVSTATESRLAAESPSTAATVVIKPVRENIFVLRDRMAREKEGKVESVIKRGSLDDFPEKCPPGGADAVVVYTTSLRGVRKTYDACSRVLSLMELQRVATDERDVSLHAEFLTELRELVGESESTAASLSLPRVFIKGRYVGGVEEVEALNESGRLGRILSWARVERGSGRHTCEGCGGARFVPCLECGGSCKVFVDGVNKGRCGKCNENGLAHCPVCH